MLTSAALGSITIANEIWVASGGKLRFDELVDEAFDTFEPSDPGR
jgi:hypothetical protein